MGLSYRYRLLGKSSKVQGYICGTVECEEWKGRLGASYKCYQIVDGHTIPYW
jgi:hypothetical protein